SLISKSKSLSGRAVPLACEPNNRILMGEPMVRMRRTTSTRSWSVTGGKVRIPAIRRNLQRANRRHDSECCPAFPQMEGSAGPYAEFIDQITSERFSIAGHPLPHPLPARLSDPTDDLPGNRSLVISLKSRAIRGAVLSCLTLTFELSVFCGSPI